MDTQIQNMGTDGFTGYYRMQGGYAPFPVACAEEYERYEDKNPV